MTSAQSVRVHGDPQPKGSLKGILRGRRVVLIEDDKTGKRGPWRRAVAQACAGLHPQTGPVAVTLGFRLRQAPSNKDEWPKVRPDIDKLARMILDAMQDSGLLTNDSQVVHLTASKIWAPPGPPGPGVRITITPVTDPPPASNQQPILERTTP